jgi:quercetin dioxygenase-like cupin family protein
MDTKKFSLEKNSVHLGLGATVVTQPEFNGMQWYEEYGKRTEADGIEGRLVSLHRFSTPWSTWEMHPQGEELVVCIHGRMTLIQEVDGQEVRVELQAGEAIINPRGVWHTADVEAEAAALFVTAGVGTQIRPRNMPT